MGRSYGRRKWWKSEEDFMDDMVWKVKNGILYYVYYPPWGNEVAGLHEWPTQKMFPATIQDIHAGWIRCKERIITVIPGDFRWEEDVIPVKCHTYGKDGRQVDSRMLTPGENGCFTVSVPENGMVILVR